MARVVVLPKVARELLGFINRGVEALGHDMPNAPGDAQAQKYREKNVYFAGAQRIIPNALYQEVLLNTSGLSVKVRLSGLAEAYYQAMLDYIMQYECSTGKPPYNKGMVCANLGIAQLRQGNVEQGLANLLLADKADRRWWPEYSILSTDLWKQFETPIMREILGRCAVKAQMPTLSSDSLIDGLVTGMPTEDRLFFVGTVWSIEYNWSVFGSRLTAFTRGRLYSYLWDLCLLTETLMRRWALNAKEFPDPRVTLCCLLQKAASCIRLKPPDPSLEPLLNASDPPGLVAGLEYLIHGSFQPAERMMRTTYLIRNFAGHHLSFSEPELDASGKPLYDDLFSKYEFALADVLTLLLYLKDQNRI